MEALALFDALGALFEMVLERSARFGVLAFCSMVTESRRQKVIGEKYS